MEKKPCIFCGELFAPEVRVDENFLVCEEPPVCSECIGFLYSLMQDDIMEYFEKHPEVKAKVLKTLADEEGNQIVASSNVNNDDMNNMRKALRQLESIPQYSNIIDTVMKTVKGQDEAVKRIATSFYHNIFCQLYNLAYPDMPRQKKRNIIVVGGTGTGKTLILTKLCKLLNRPYVIADATSYTMPGYKGDDLENIFLRLVDAADGDIKLAQKGLIIFDEADKLRKKSDDSSGADPTGSGVINALIKKIEGCEFDIGKGKVFDSTDTMFAFLGVFDGLEEIRKERLTGRSKTVGFGLPKSKINADAITEYIGDDLVKQGFSGEFVGRAPCIVELSKLTEEVMIDILLNSDESPFIQNQVLFQFAYGIKIIAPTRILSLIATQALKYNIGARGLERTIETILNNVEGQLLACQRGEYNFVCLNESDDGKVSAKLYKSQNLPSKILEANGL